uniref:EGF-like domain-containing protein n=1 Tax=Tetraselmis chuii TaxID=63592 RepID=A0A7S1SX90_9CHLO|mmetsp:Transcript_34342/g.61280  ORF Transcript_34342/g.61280 Transcript_34342/m.61280 type:complete len:804 (+) Transcript_34342:214-2625(+)
MGSQLGASQRVVAFLIVAALLSCATRLIVAQSELNCGTHGSEDPSHRGQCICENPHPEPGEMGWTGHSCTIEVYGAVGNGTDETASCASQRCNFLEPDAMRCWSYKAEWVSRFNPWNYLTLQLNRTSGEGDPDLYGMFWGGSSGEGRTVDEENVFFMGQFDFQETSSSRHPLVGMTVNKGEDIGMQFDYQGVYLCVHAYGEIASEFSLRTTTTLCPSSIDEDGQLLTCSTRANAPESEKRYDSCLDGTCMCRGPYKKPFAAVYEGLGFESCAAEIVPVAKEARATKEKVIGHNQWVFFTFNVTATDFEIAVNVFAQKAGSNGEVELYLSHSAPPTDEFGKYEVSGGTRFSLDDADREKAQFSKMDPSVWREGLWYAGVRNTGMRTLYNLEIIRFPCPSGCNGHGQCTEDHVCLCDRTYFKEDCSAKKSPLAFDRPVHTPTPEVFETVYYELPEMEGKGNVEVTVTVQCWTSAKDVLFEMVTPLVYLKGSDKKDDYPTYKNHTMRQDVLVAHQSYNLYIPSSLLAKNWILAIENPSHTAPLGYSILVSRHAFCLNGCIDESHGECQIDGKCRCKGDWTGADCAIPASACKEDTFRAQHRDKDKGTCWQKCVCSGSTCSFLDQCVEFTCERKREGGDLPRIRDASTLRRVIGQDLCVEDECTEDLVAVNAEEGFVCTQPCICPEDGGACWLDQTCNAGSKVCLVGSSASACAASGDAMDYYKPRAGGHSGLPVWGLLLGMLFSFLGGTGLMMWLVIRRDKQRGNSLHTPYDAVGGEELGDSLLTVAEGQGGLEPPNLEEVVPSNS